MTSWQPRELDAIGRADELQIITRRADGSNRPPVPIWVVRDGDDIYVRAYRGTGSDWYRHATRDQIGRIRVPGLEREVLFEPASDESTGVQIDEAYRVKYARYGNTYVKPMTASAAKHATLRLIPRNNEDT